jgi:AcrR family transcriptional regulator
MATCDVGGGRPRERIIKTARDLFRRHGIRGVGVDAIAEQAGTNKMTLYRHFGPKDELIIACLRDFANDVEGLWQSFETSYPQDPMAQLHAWVRVTADCTLGDMRGCDMANVAVELAEDDHPARHVIEEFKTTQRDRLADLCRDAGIAKADLLADTLCLLIEGARVSVQSAGLAGPGGRYISIAEAVIAAFAQESKNRGRIDTANEAPKTQSERRLADVRAVIEHA